MADLSTSPPASDEQEAKAAHMKNGRPRQGPGSKTFANFHSAMTSLRTHRRYTLLAIASVFSTAMIVMAIDILLQNAQALFHIQIYAQVITLLQTSIAGVFYLVGALLLMATLLMMEMARTWEFSIRLVVGARRRDIRSQLLFEVVLLCVAGGSAGSASGLLIAFAVTTVLLHQSFVMHPVELLLLVSASILPGIVCGLYPVLKVSHLDFEKVLRTGY